METLKSQEVDPKEKLLLTVVGTLLEEVKKGSECNDNLLHESVEEWLEILYEKDNKKTI